MIGLLVSASLYLHVGAKYVFVRILRDSVHLQKNSVTHWTTWLGCTFIITAVGFLLGSGVPIFNYLLALAGSVCFAPLSLVLPGFLWVYDHQSFRTGTALRKVSYWLHWGLILLGFFLTVAGTYSVVQELIDAYASGKIDRAFSCADNSGSS